MLTRLLHALDLEQINPVTLKSVYLRGLVGLFTDPPVVQGAPPTPWPDELFWVFLSKGAERIKELANVIVAPERVLEVHDYRARDYVQMARLTLFKAPVHQVTSVKAVYPSTGVVAGSTQAVNSDGSQTIFDFPLEWVRLYADGSLHLVPTQGSLSNIMLGRGGAYIPLVYGALEYLPQLWQIEYVAGFQNTKVPYIVADALFKIAAIEALTTLSDTLKPVGASSVSVSFDGISRNTQFESGRGRAAAVFASRIEAYQKEVYGSSEAVSTHEVGGLIKQIRDRYHGVSMVVA